MFTVLPTAAFTTPSLLNVVGDMVSVPDCTSISPVLFTVSAELELNVVVPAPVIFVKVPLLLNVATPPWVFITVPSPVALSAPALLNTAPLPMLIVPLPLHTPPVLWLVNVRPDDSVGLPLIVSPAAGATVVEPVPDIVPPDQVNAPLIVSAPLPVKIPLASVNVPPAVEASDTVSVPPPIEMISLDCNLPENCVPVLTVIVGLNAPRSMMTICPATGSPALQFAGTLQSAVVSLSQTLTPVNVMPRCRNAVLLTVCVT